MYKHIINSWAYIRVGLEAELNFVLERECTYIWVGV